MKSNSAKTPILYILMRDDLASMTTGKACAHAAHAANQMENFFADRDGDLDLSEDIQAIFQVWKNQTEGGFGTTVTLFASRADIQSIVRYANASPTIAAEMVVDPTYPIQDGDVTHLLDIPTCGYVFGYKDEVAPILQHLPMNPKEHRHG